MLIPLLLGCVLHAEPTPTAISEAKKDATGFFVHEVRSPYQAGTTLIRVLMPEGKPGDKPWPVVYVLPVEAKSESRFGDGLAEVQKLDLANKLRAVFVVPTFSHLPWYADHPTNPEIRQETYLLKAVLPFVEKTYPVRAEPSGRLLLGFSKSGWGAFVLLLRNPDIFGRAAAWDTPLMLDTHDRYGSGAIFGTPENFERYQFSKLVKVNATMFQKEPRFILHGWGGFQAQHEKAHTLMNEFKVKHVYLVGERRKHDWHSGWVEGLAKELVTEQ